MGDTTRALDLIDEILSEGVERGIMQVEPDDAPLDGRHLRVGGRRVLHFGSSSYLGLELDPRVVEGAIRAARRYGAQFSSSRSYVSAPIYAELEELLEQIFGRPVLVAPNTTLAHLAALPIIVGEGDAAILDHQVHQSVQMAVPQLRFQGTHVELVRHGRLDLLEERIVDLSKRHPRVWYLADGVYSMFGDFAPLKAMAWLLARHEQLHLYIDDAHGMSWTGERGRGVAAEAFAGRDRVVVAVSLNKAFGAAGGALVFPEAELRRRVRTCGGPMIFTGPLQPPMLGAAVESARIHLGPEIGELQEALRRRIRLANRLSRELGIPLASPDEVPIRFVALSARESCIDMAHHLLSRGFFTNPASFPAVGARRSGVRFMLTVHHTEEDVRRLLETTAEHLPTALERGNTTREEVDRSFGLRGSLSSTPAARAGSPLVCRHESRIAALDASEWDRLLGDRGTFDAASLAAYEEAFGSRQPPESHWRFHYYTVRDGDGHPCLATFFTEAIWKDDLLASARVSRTVEGHRDRDAYFLTSRTLAMGCLLTEGNHLHLDRDRDWRGALSLLIAAANEQRDECEAASVVLRDLPGDDEALDEALVTAGFFRVDLPPSLVIDVDWSTRAEYLGRRSKRERRFHRERVEPWESAWEVEIRRPGGRPLRPDEWRHLYELYRNVHRRQFALNTFPLPAELLPRLVRCPGWELVALRLSPAHGGHPDDPPRGFAACHARGGTYTPVFFGMDYAFVESHGLYRQLLSKTLQRAEALGARRVALGMGSELEKRRFGARPVPRAMYVQSYDRFHHDVLSLIAADVKR